jgi:hypothetical protein
MRYALLIGLVLAFASPALAQHAHDVQKGPNGGQMEDVAGVHVELVTSGNTLTLNVFDEAGKPVGTNGYAASAMVSAGTQRDTLKLEPAGTNSLKGDAKSPITTGSSVTVTLKTGAGKSGQARFKL